MVNIKRRGESNMKKLPTNCLKIVLGVGLVAGVGTVALNHDNIYNHMINNFKKGLAVASTKTEAIDTENEVKKAGAVVEQAEKEVQEAEVKLNAANEELKKAEATKNEATEAAKKADNAVQEANVAKEQAEKALRAAKTEEEKKVAQAKLDAAKAEQKRAEEAKKEADAKLKAAEEARLKAEEEARKAAKTKKEAEAKKQAAEEAKKKAEAEAAKKKAEEEAKAKAEITKKGTKTTTTENQNKNATVTNSETSESRSLTDEQLKKMLELAAKGEEKDREQYEKAYTEKYGHAPEEKHEVEFHFYSTLNPLTVRLYDHDNYYTPSKCGETGSGCIWFAEFSCDLNQCVGFLDTHTNELKDNVIYAKRASIKEYTMKAPEARYGYKFKQWEIISDRKNITVNGQTGIAYKYIAIYEKI